MNRYDVLLKKPLPSRPPVRYGLSYDPAVPSVATKDTFIGAQVITWECLHDDEYTELGRSSRKWGMEGVVQCSHDSHGLCYEVLHKDGTIGCYDPDELRLMDQQCKHKFYHDSGHRFKCIYCNLVVNSHSPLKKQ